MRKFSISVVSPEKNLYIGDATSVIFPSTDGYIGIMYGFEGSAFVVTEGTIKISDEEIKKEIPVKSGILTCKNNIVSITLD